MAEAERSALVAWERVEGWVARFEARHPGTVWLVDPEAVHGSSPDGSTAHFELPFPPLADTSMPGVFAHLVRPRRLGVVLVRRGGFAVARLVGDELAASKIGRRHVQGRTKAGGWSQQRFARRRDNQARAAFDAAAEHVQSLLLPHAARLEALIVGGDRAAVESVLGHAELRPLAACTRLWIGGVADPRRDVLMKAIATGRSLPIGVVDTAPR